VGGDSLDDSTLVIAAGRADRTAMAELVARHRPLLLALCRRSLGDADLAEDAAQEAILLALLSLGQLRQPESFGPWLAGIGLNVCRRWSRRQAQQAWSLEALLGGTVTEPVDASPGPAEIAEAAEAATRIRSAVAALPPGQRAAVAGFYLAGLTVTELAQELGISVGAVKARLHKGRMTLRRDLAPWWRAHPARPARPPTGREHGAPNGREEACMASTAATQGTASEFVTMRIADVRQLPADGDIPERCVVVLEEAEGDRRLPIWIGHFEATWLALAVEGASMPRPGSYALTLSLVSAAGGELREVRIDRLSEGVFYATVVVDGPDGSSEVDARPSDALNLALIAGVPIRATTAVLDTDATSPALLAAADAEGGSDASTIVARFLAHGDRNLAASASRLRSNPGEAEPPKRD
jgi:RNA polymerase sigma factor (sigma-70 family)